MNQQQKEMLLRALRIGLRCAAEWYCETGSLTAHANRREIDEEIKKLEEMPTTE